MDSHTAWISAWHATSKSRLGSMAGVARPEVMIFSCSIAWRIAAMLEAFN